MLPVPELSSSDWHDTIDTKLTSAFLGAKYQPAMLERGGGQPSTGLDVGLCSLKPRHDRRTQRQQRETDA
jgi:hypothetical protein